MIPGREMHFDCFSEDDKSMWTRGIQLAAKVRFGRVQRVLARFSTVLRAVEHGLA